MYLNDSLRTIYFIKIDNLDNCMTIINNCDCYYTLFHLTLALFNVYNFSVCCLEIMKQNLHSWRERIKIGCTEYCCGILL